LLTQFDNRCGTPGDMRRRAIGETRSYGALYKYGINHNIHYAYCAVRCAVCVRRQTALGRETHTLRALKL